jgi:hypothetical protein
MHEYKIHPPYSPSFTLCHFSSVKSYEVASTITSMLQTGNLKNRHLGPPPDLWSEANLRTMFCFSFLCMDANESLFLNLEKHLK